MYYTLLSTPMLISLLDSSLFSLGGHFTELGAKLPQTLFWHIYNFFLMHFQVDVKMCPGRKNTHLDDYHMVW